MVWFRDPNLGVVNTSMVTEVLRADQLNWK
jgi:hypothetical protein